MKSLKIFVVLVVIIVASIAFYKRKSHIQITPTLGYGYKNPNSLSSAKGEVSNFSLLDHQGVFHELYRNSDARAIVIISQANDCPVIQKYSPLISELKKKYKPRKIEFFLINSNPHDTRQSIIDTSSSYQFNIPILMDPSQLIAETLGITRTSEAVVIDPNGWKIIYRGAIGEKLENHANNQKSHINHLDDVLDSVINSKNINPQFTTSQGRLISFTRPASLSYEKAIAPILKQKCLSCHSDNGNFPPKLSSHEKLKSWIAMSREAILTDRMPPFSADPHYGSYSNDISLTTDEKRALVKWFDDGALKDGNSDPLIGYNPSVKTFNLNKHKPLYIAEMPAPHEIPEGGEIEYKYFQLGGAVPFEMWTKGYWTKSTRPRQLHHESLFIVSKPLAFYKNLAQKMFKIDESEIKTNTDGDIFLYTLVAMEKYETQFNPDLYTKFQVWGAGRPQPFVHAKHVGAHIPKGSYLILETHYMGTGKVETEKTSIEFYGVTKKPPQLKAIHNLTLTNTNFEIPPMVKDYVVESKEWVAPKDIHIRSFLGHLHMRGTSIKVEVKTPTGEVKTIVSIPNYNYGWQTGAALTPIEPIHVKAGSVLKGICHYDNSPLNPYNPDPTKKVRFGQRVDRTEMCKFNSGYTID